MLFSVVASAVGFAATAIAHGGVLSYNIAGTTYQGFVPYNSPTGQSTIQREWDTYNPIQDPTQSDIQCNTNGAVAAKTATVAAGSTIVAYWNAPWPHDIGPMFVSMANCNGDCSKFTPSGAVWFKISQAGLISGDLPTGLWGSGEMINQNNSWTVTIPKTLKAGNYLIRHETVALHTTNQPQWYPECATLTVTGSGTATPNMATYGYDLVKTYENNPQFYIDVYSQPNVSNWTIPGPAVWTG